MVKYHGTARWTNYKLSIVLCVYGYCVFGSNMRPLASTHGTFILDGSSLMLCARVVKQGLTEKMSGCTTAADVNKCLERVK